MSKSVIDFSIFKGAEEQIMRLENHQLIEEIGLPEDLKCRFCGSFYLVKSGKRNNKEIVKQLYHCNDCNRKSVLFPYTKLTKNHIDLILRSKTNGLSFRQIKDLLKLKYNINIDHSNICRLFNKLKNNNIITIPHNNQQNKPNEVSGNSSHD